MVKKASDALKARPATADNAVWLGAPWGFLRREEALYLYYLARDYYRGEGVVVDAGSFLGRSAWLFGTGLAANQHLGHVTTPLVHCFDNFIVNERFTSEAIQQALGHDLPLGSSTRHLFDAATGPIADWLDVHEGDFHLYPWPPRPVEILFVDITKSASLNRRLVELMFPCLMPGRSVVVQQDYHHPWLPHVHMSMECLHEYFEIVEPKVDDSAVFLLHKQIPVEALHAAATVGGLPIEQQLALMDQAIERLPEGNRHHVELARAYLLGVGRGYEAMRAGLEEIDAKYPALAGDDQWDSYRGQMVAFLAELRKSARDA